MQVSDNLEKGKVSEKSENYTKNSTSDVKDIINKFLGSLFNMDDGANCSQCNEILDSTNHSRVFFANKPLCSKCFKKMMDDKFKD
jgi:hypothetical protein